MNTIEKLIWDTYQKFKEADKQMAKEYLAAAMDYYYTGSWEHAEGIVEVAMIGTKFNIDTYKKR